MKLFLLGATGRTGRRIVELGLERGHEVTAFVRSPQKIAPRERLSIVRGDPRSTPDIERAVRDHDAVLSAIGPSFGDAMRASTLLTDCAASAVAAATSAGVSRFAIVSAALLFDERDLAFRFFGWVLRHHIADLRTMEAIVTASDLDWTVARPPRLVDREERAYRAADGALPNGSRVVSFAAVAAFLVDAIERGAHRRAIVGLAR
jgi:putative NADH-flavin reductase